MKAPDWPSFWIMAGITAAVLGAITFGLVWR